MIADLSQSLREMLTQAGSAFDNWSAVHIVFDRPTDAFNPTQPTLSLYLYDVRENAELRSNETHLDWKNGQAVLTRAPMRVACTYLVTAWPGSGAGGDAQALGEHQLLSQALTVFARNRSVPPQYLQGSLVGQLPALPVITARAEGLPNPSEFWTSLSNKLRPSLTVTITISMPVQDEITAPPVISSEIVIKRDGAVDADRFRVGGRITDASGAALAGAVVTLTDSGLGTQADEQGRYVLGNLGAGTHPLRVQGKSSNKNVSIVVPAASAAGYDVQLD
jgi:hypothetical protein